MKIITVGLAHKYVEEFRAVQIVVDVADEDDFDPIDWLGTDLYDAMVVNLDIGLGTMICRELRREKIHTPVIAVATYDPDGLMSWSEIRTSFLDHGGDDLMQYPFNPAELLASLRSTIRRVNSENTTSMVTFEDTDLTIKMDQVSRELYINDVPVHLTGQEREMMLMLMNRQGLTISKEQFVNGLYGTSHSDGEIPETKIVDVFICKMRKKLKNVHPTFDNIITVWGKGYVLRKKYVAAAFNGGSSATSELTSEL